MIELDLPVPPSVNKARRVNWPYQVKVKHWYMKADVLLLSQKYRPLFLERFELHITLSEAHTRMDLDNGVKAMIDYLRRIELIANDAPENLRRLTVEWGAAPEGCRVQIRPWKPA